MSLFDDFSVFRELRETERGFSAAQWGCIHTFEMQYDWILHDEAQITTENQSSARSKRAFCDISIISNIFHSNVLYFRLYQAIKR
jgi:hypothetical protein